jgi:hypothetical protein
MMRAATRAMNGMNSVSRTVPMVVPGARIGFAPAALPRAAVDVDDGADPQ